MRVLLLLLCLSTAHVAVSQPLGRLVITEVLANPGGTTSDASGEWFELHNNSPLPINLNGYAIRDSAASGLRPIHVINADVIVAPWGFVVLGNSTNTTNNGGAAVDYSYGSALALANSLDRIQIIDPDLVTVIDRAAYASAAISAQNGISRELLDISFDNFNIDGANWANALETTVYGDGGRGTPGTAGQTGGILPVELVAFEGVSRGNSVLLSWQTASETNNWGFHVEQQTGGTWRSVGYVLGVGTTLEASNYGFEVKNLLPGVHTFRLRQVDFDGTMSMSAAVEVAVEMESAVELMPIAPNPVRGAARVQFATREATVVRVAVYNALGQEVAQLFQGEMQGVQAAQFDASSVPAGMYLIRLESQLGVQTRFVTVVR